MSGQQTELYHLIKNHLKNKDTDAYLLAGRILALHSASDLHLLLSHHLSLPADQRSRIERHRRRHDPLFVSASSASTSSSAPVSASPSAPALDLDLDSPSLSLSPDLDPNSSSTPHQDPATPHHDPAPPLDPRDVCGCFGELHSYARNCLACGRVHCAMETDANCAFCRRRLGGRAKGEGKKAALCARDALLARDRMALEAKKRKEKKIGGTKPRDRARRPLKNPETEAPEFSPRGAGHAVRGGAEHRVELWRRRAQHAVDLGESHPSRPVEPASAAADAPNAPPAASDASNASNASNPPRVPDARHGPAVAKKRKRTALSCSWATFLAAGALPACDRVLLLAPDDLDPSLAPPGALLAVAGDRPGFRVLGLPSACFALSARDDGGAFARHLREEPDGAVLLLRGTPKTTVLKFAEAWEGPLEVFDETQRAREVRKEGWTVWVPTGKKEEPDIKHWIEQR